LFVEKYQRDEIKTGGYILLRTASLNTPVIY